MKRFIYSAAVLASLIFAGSCQRETMEPVSMSDTVSITVQTPGAMSTKAIADGTNVNEVHYAVYMTNEETGYEKFYLEGEDTDPLAQGSVAMQNKYATVEFELLQDQDYTVIFWAQVKDAGHYVLGDLRQISAKGTEVEGNDESRAAFFAKYEFNTDEHKDHTVTLVRPFAQLNLGTTVASLTPVLTGQTSSYTIDVQKSAVAISGISKTFSTITGKALAEETEFTYTIADTPAKAGEKLMVSGTEYHYVAMNYLFVPENEKLVKVSYEITTDMGVVVNEIENVPFKANYRTNIIGNLLTSKTQFKIFVDETFYGDFNGDENGNFAPAYNEQTKAYEITNLSELQWVATQVNEEGNAFSGKTLMLMNDIDLGGVEWTPISGFSGTFVGAELTKAGETYPTISNFKVDVAKAGGLFGTVTNGKFENFNITGADVKSNHYAGVLVGYMHGTGYVKNVHVSSSKVTVIPVLNDEGKYDDGDKAGAIAGYFCEDGKTMLMEGCSATKVEILAYRDLGGLVGCLNGDSAYVKGCKVADARVTADTDYDYKDDSQINAGKVVGRVSGGAVVADDNVAGDDVVVTVIKPLAELVKVEGAIIELLPNRAYTLPSNIAKNVTIVGDEGTVMNVVGTSVTADNFTLKNVTIQNDGKASAAIRLSGLNPTLENCVIKGAAGNGYGVVVSSDVADNTITLKNCDFSQDDFFKPVFDGWSGLAGATLVMDGCKLANGLYTMHIDGNDDLGKIIVKNSEVSGFTTNGASLESVTFENCVFGAAAGYACVNVYTSHSFINCTFPTKESVNNIDNYGLYISSKAKGDKLVINDCKMSDGTALTLANIAVADGGFLHWDNDTAAMDVTLNGSSIVTVIPEDGVVVNDTTYVKLAKTCECPVKISGNGTLVLDNVTIKTASGAGIEFAEGSDVILTGAKLSVEAEAGSAITGMFITISGFDGLTAKGNGKDGYGIGAADATVTIKNSTIDYACGGHVQPLFVNDTEYGKTEPEGAPAIGGAVINIEESTITKVDGGSKAAAIGARYWQSTDITIKNSTIVEANGGNASAAIGGSRYSGDISADNKQVIRINIENSTIKNATGGQFGAGIGAGYDTYCKANDENAVNDILITNSNITAKGGKYAAGIGTGYHSAALTGSIDAASTINAIAGESRDKYTIAQDIGYGVVDPEREYNGTSVTFTIAGQIIDTPTVQ